MTVTPNTNSMAIILMGHGSRVPGAAEGMEQVACRLREGYGYRIVETCSMSQLGPRFREALLKCVTQGATTVVVVPYFLHMGMHVRSDVPQIMQEAAAELPEIKVILGGHLGYDECLVDLVQRRIAESAQLCDVRELEIDPPEAHLSPMDQDDPATRKQQS